MPQKRTSSNEKHINTPKRPKKFFVHVERKPEVQKSRLNLPVCMHEQEIVEAIHTHDVVLVTGATGTGKTTQVPQFLVEDGFGHPLSPSTKGAIAVTQPRRVAAVSCAKRVAKEMNSPLGGLVGYQIRHESKVSSETRIKFGTDGIFLREVEHDILLKKYSAVIIDEAHERSLNTDLLLSFLSRSIIMRREKKEIHGLLKVIIMSATLDVDGVFSGPNALFPNPPIINVPSRQFPITVHFAKQTADDYVLEAYRKTTNIHKRLPQGGVLIFLSGREEVERLCVQLREEFGHRKVRVEGSEGVELRMRVMPFYSLLPDHLQRHVFVNTPEDVRKVVVATNIAETSVTVPGISYVVDSGRAKEKVYRGKGCARLSAYEVGWISRASAEQRAGRAGRTGPGHCYRLYSSAVYVQQFEEFRVPEVLRVPADTVVLRLRAMGIRHVMKFPFATAPRAEDVQSAERLLTDLGALASAGREAPLGVTELGRQLAALPVEPRLGRLLLRSRANAHALPLACRLGGVLSIGSVLQRGSSQSFEPQACLRHIKSDLLTELAAVCAVEYAGNSNRPGASLDTTLMRTTCRRLALHTKSVLEALSISRQVARAIGLDPTLLPVGPPDEQCVEALLCAVIAGFGDHIARRLTRDEAAASGVIPKWMNRAFVTAGSDAPIFLEGGSSVQLDRDVRFVCFSELVEIETKQQKRKEDQDDYVESEEEEEYATIPIQEKTNDKPSFKKRINETISCKSDSNSGKAEKRIVMRGVSIVKENWIMEEAKGMCEWSLIRGCDPEYDDKRKSVTERVSVRYKGNGWRLGTKRVTIDDARPLMEERRQSHCAVFAKALVSGKVDKKLRLQPEEGKVEIYCRQLQEILMKHDIYSVCRLKQCHAELDNQILNALEVCCNSQHRQEVVYRWTETLGLLFSIDEKVESIEIEGNQSSSDAEFKRALALSSKSYQAMMIDIDEKIEILLDIVDDRTAVQKLFHDALSNGFIYLARERYRDQLALHRLEHITSDTRLMESKARFSIRQNEYLEHNTQALSSEIGQDAVLKKAQHEFLVFERYNSDGTSKDSMSLNASGLRQRRNAKTEQRDQPRESVNVSSKLADFDYQSTPVAAMPSTEIREAIKFFTIAIDQALQLVSVNKKASALIDRLYSVRSDNKCEAHDTSG